MSDSDSVPLRERPANGVPDERRAVRDELQDPEQYKKHAPAILSYLRSRLPLSSRDDIEDLVATTWLRAMRGSASFQEGRELWPWLFGIARRVLLDYVERGQKEGKLLAALAENARSDATGHARDEGALDRMLRLEMRDHLIQALANLSQRCRDIVWLQIVDQLPRETICQRLGITIGAFHGQRPRCLRQLREYLEHGGGNDA